MNFLLSVTLLIALLNCTSSPKKKLVENTLPVMTLQEAVDSPLRTLEFRLRDQYRHPLETLTFFGVTPDMTVVEIWPSGGWYTEILAPFLSAKGQYIIADPESDPNGYTNKRKEWMNAHPEISSRVSYSVFQPPHLLEISPPNSVDMVLTFRNVHNWLPTSSQEAAFRSFFKALRPGGILGVVEHRANPKVKYDPKSGYVPTREVIRMALLAGFKLEFQSEINANKKDKTNYRDGVWTLPPRLKLGEKNKAKYIAIGESDRMTLKFFKPQ